MWTAVLAALAALVTWLARYFSAEAELGRRKVETARGQGREAVEAERLRAAVRRIEQEPPAPDPAEALNERIRRLRGEGPPPP